MTSTDESPDGACQSMVIVGGGVMGQGIARLFAGAGIAVTVVEPRDVPVPHPAVTMARALPPHAHPDLIIEAVFEDRGAKLAVYHEAESLYRGRPVLATN